LYTHKGDYVVEIGANIRMHTAISQKKVGEDRVVFTMVKATSMNSFLTKLKLFITAYSIDKFLQLSSEKQSLALLTSSSG